MIPKMIHFIWVGSKIPSWVDHLIIDRWRELNPDFQIICHGEELLDYCSPEYKKMYEQIEDVSSKSDILRLAVLRKEGGWYFDCDFIPLRPMSDLYKEYDMSKGCFLTKQWEVGAKRIANGIIGISTDAEAWKEIDEAFADACAGPLERTSFGPLLTTRVVTRIPYVSVGQVKDFYPVRFQADTWPVLARLVKSNYSLQEREAIFGNKNPFMCHMWLGGKKYAQPELTELIRKEEKKDLVPINKKFIQVVCILRKGGLYKAEDANRLQFEVKEHLHVPYRFTCLTDNPKGINCKTIPLKHKWPEQWSRIELFKRNKEESDVRMLYFDLDTAIVGSIDNLAEVYCDFAMVSDKSGSGMIMWEGDYSVVYDAFLSQEGWVLQNSTSCDWKFISRHVTANYQRPKDMRKVIDGVCLYSRNFVAEDVRIVIGGKND